MPPTAPNGTQTGLPPTSAAQLQHSVLRLEKDQPKFELERVQLQFDLQGKLQRLLVENDMMYTIASDAIYRIDLKNPTSSPRVALPAGFSTITGAWLHPEGRFLIVQVDLVHYFHLHGSYTRLKPLPRLRGLAIEHMAFGPVKEASSGEFLFSTSDGKVYVGLLKLHDPATQDNKKDDKVVKHIYTTKLKITGLTFTNNHSQVQLYAEDTVFAWDCFELTVAELTSALRQNPHKTHIPGAKGNYRFLARGQTLYYIVNASGLLHSNDEEIQLSAGNLLEWGEHGLFVGKQAFLVSDHHVMFLSADKSKLVIKNKLQPSNAVVKQLPSVMRDESIMGVTADALGNTYWLFTRSNIYELVITDESISVWYSYYSMGQYERALELVEAGEKNGDSWLRKNVILVKQGYELLQKGGFGLQLATNTSLDKDQFSTQIEGIQCLAKLLEPFEKVVTTILDLSKDTPQLDLIRHQLLEEYLSIKLASARTERLLIRKTILSTWITRLLLRRIQILENMSESFDSDENEAREEAQARLVSSRDSLTAFLTSNRSILDKVAVYQLMKSMDNSAALLEFADLLQDYHFIAQYHVEHESWREAIKAISKLYAQNPEKSKETIYETSNAFLLNDPKITTDFWLTVKDLDYSKVIPAILLFNRLNDSIPFAQNPIFQFFLKLLSEKNVREPVVSNAYLTLLIAYPVHLDESRICKSITKTMDLLRKDDQIDLRRQPRYDPDFLLRICLQFKKYEPAVLILVFDLHLYGAALDIALEHHLCSLAEMVLRKADELLLSESSGSTDNENAEYSQTMDIPKLEEESYAARRKLWMKYATFLINLVCSGNESKLPASISGQPMPQSGNGFGKQKDNGSSNGHSQESDVLTLKLSQVIKYLLLLSGAGVTGSGILTLKELLPLLPDSVKIINFKEEIVESLNDYNNKINQLGLEMQESAPTAKKLRSLLKESKEKQKQGQVYSVIEPGEPCPFCNELLIQLNFLVFPNCQHSFHRACTVRFFLQLKGDYRFEKLFQEFKNSTLTNESELDELLCKECPQCNESALSSIDDPLITMYMRQNKVEEWAL